MKKSSTAIAALAVLVLAALPAVADPIDAPTAFEQIKALGGTWRGDISAEGDEAEAEAEGTLEAVHEFRLSAGGTVVMEMMGPGSEYEMINMYHLDGEDLILTHYCSSGNQPFMRLDPGASSDTKLVFAFAGGTNFDPAMDHHIHSAELNFLGPDRLDSIWSANSGGEQVGIMRFHLERTE